MTGILLFALDNPAVLGPINGTAPNPVTNKQFGKALGAALHRPAFVWTPAAVLKFALGDVVEIIAQGQRVIPKKAMTLGYAFKFPTIEVALTNIVG
jgi:NAD dependent epimerase/dehydratase family enzyme